MLGDMLYIKDDVKEQAMKKYGFKKCKKPYDMLYYLCVARGVQVIYIGDGIFVQDWEENDPRIHKRANCRYRSNNTVIDILFDMIQDGFVEKKTF